MCHWIPLFHWSITCSSGSFQTGQLKRYSSPGPSTLFLRGCRSKSGSASVSEVKEPLPSLLIRTCASSLAVGHKLSFTCNTGPQGIHTVRVSHKTSHIIYKTGENTFVEIHITTTMASIYYSPCQQLGSKHVQHATLRLPPAPHHSVSAHTFHSSSHMMKIEMLNSNPVLKCIYII